MYTGPGDEPIIAVKRIAAAVADIENKSGFRVPAHEGFHSDSTSDVESDEKRRKGGLVSTALNPKISGILKALNCFSQGRHGV